jgi:hypothetical protein
MSAECERLFSSAGRMMTQQRLSLDAVMVSMCQVLWPSYQTGPLTATESSLLQGKGRGGEKINLWLESVLEEYDLEEVSITHHTPCKASKEKTSTLLIYTSDR